MKNFLLFLSLCISAIQFAYGCEPTADAEIVGTPRKYKFELTTSKANISGILVTRDTPKEIVGSIVNDFGISTLEFKYDKKKGKIKLLFVTQFLNKWYIKLVLRKDIAVCIRKLYNLNGNIPKSYLITEYEDSLIVFNKKRNLTYRFSALEQNQEQEHDTSERALYN